MYSMIKIKNSKLHSIVKLRKVIIGLSASAMPQYFIFLQQSYPAQLSTVRRKNTTNQSAGNISNVKSAVQCANQTCVRIDQYRSMTKVCLSKLTQSHAIAGRHARHGGK